MGPMQWPVAELGGRIGLGLLSPFTYRILLEEVLSNTISIASIVKVNRLMKKFPWFY